MNVSLKEKLIKQPPNWRFPDHSGLCERTLDCLQLSVKEILEWQHQRELIKVFLNPLDCTSTGLLLRRRQPVLNQGWYITKNHSIPFEYFKHRVQSEVEKNGYCLIFFNPYHMSFTDYYERYHLKHWSLVIDVKTEGLLLVDEAGRKPIFEQFLGQIPWEALERRWECSSEFGFATLTQNNMHKNWDDEFANMIQQSVNQMQEEGLQYLQSFVSEIKRTPHQQIITNLETLEFDVHYFRRLRELWKNAIHQKVIPTSYIQPGWIEEIHHLCNTWSLVMGVLMKWKRQPERDYRSKLLGYLKDAIQSETDLITEWTNMLRSEKYE